MGLRQLLWRRRWVLLLAAAISAAAAVPSLLSAPRGFTSQADVFIAPTEPVEVGIRTVAPLAVAIGAYESGELRDAVRTALGEDAARVDSIEVTQDRESGLHRIAVQATSRDVAAKATGIAAQLVIDESRTLGADQLEELRASIEEQLADVQRRRFDAHQERAQAEASGAGRFELSVFGSRLAVIASERQGLLNEMESASGTVAIREATTRRVRGPTTPQSNFSTRIVETVGLALVVGIVMATLTIVWLERRSLTPRGEAPPRPSDGRAAQGMFHPGTPRRADGGSTHSTERGARR